MNSLLHTRWNFLKEEIEKLKPFALNPTIVMKIRKLKDEASVIRFAIEDKEILGLPQQEVLARMIENREGYQDLWNNYEVSNEEA